MKSHHPILFGAAAALTLLMVGPAQAALVAYYPLNEGMVGSAVTGADDVIDAPGQPYNDATVEGTGGMWVNDPMRGTVFSTGENDRLVLGTQGIDLDSRGFTWSFWAKVDSGQPAEPGADVIIGSRTGRWNKIQPTGTQRWADIGGYNIADDTWHHVAFVGTTEPRATLYIDGVSVGSDTAFFGGPAINDKFELGGSSQFGEDVTALLGDVAIWNHALPVSQIVDLANGAPVQGPAQLIAGVDFESAADISVFDRTPDDLDPLDGITVSGDWTLGSPGDLRNDNGANSAGATSPNFPARLQNEGSWSISIPTDVILDLDRIEFDVRSATGGSGGPGGRDMSFTTSIAQDASVPLLFDGMDFNNRPEWTHVVVDLSDSLHQGLSGQSVSFIFNSPNAVDLDSIQLFGAIAPPIPEPATASLAMLSLLGLTRRRRAAA